MSLELLERSVGRTLVATGALAGTYALWARHNRQERFARLPEGGLEQSMLPFYGVLPEIIEECGIAEYTSMGGLAKQALADPDTVFDPDNHRYFVLNPDSRTIDKATLFRPKEANRRDFDIRVAKLWVDDELRVANAELTDAGIKDEKRLRMQQLLDRHANTLGFPQGPEVSLFFYEHPFGSFRPTHYATRTTFNPETNEETMFATTGESLTLPVDDIWECIVALPDTPRIVIPVNSPRTHLGRTLTRPVVERTRDRRDVDDAVLNIRAKGLGDVLLGDIWDEYTNFRRELDMALSLKVAGDLLQRGDVKAAAGMLLARYVGIPLAPKIEDSEIAAAMRDPGHPIGRYAARVVGAQ